MTALYIAAGILLLLAALLLVRVQVGVSYIGDLRVELRLGPLQAGPDAGACRAGRARGGGAVRRGA